MNRRKLDENKKKIVNQYNVKGNITIKNVNSYSIENILLHSEIDYSENSSKGRDNNNNSIINKLRNEFEEITNSRKNINESEEEEEVELLDSMNSSIIISNRNPIHSYNDYNCINKQISFSIKRKCEYNVQELNETIRKMKIVIDVLSKYIHSQENVILKYNAEFANKVILNEEKKIKTSQLKINQNLVNENKELKKKFLRIIDTIRVFEYEQRKMENKREKIIIQLYKENEYLRKCLCDYSNVGANIKEEIFELNKFDILREETINKKEKRFREINEELRMITEGKISID